MITSILDREKRSINIDRLVITTLNGDKEMITNPNLIKTKVNKHFQTCALPHNHHEIPTLSKRWIDQYLPKDYVDENIYNYIFDPITSSEWSTQIHSLLNNKALGPSGIKNEFLKHLSETTNDLLILLCNHCLFLENIPGA